jgi:hypothetical protein
MAYAPLALAPQGLAIPDSPAHTGNGVFARVIDAMVAARQHDAEREIARYITASGGKFTDETEREIERRFLSSSPQW